MIKNAELADLTLTDPTYQANDAPGIFHRVARRLIRDERDVPFVRLIVLLSLTVIPAATLLYVPGVYSIWLALGYWAMIGYFIGPFILMLHLTSHRRLFRHHLNALNLYIPWVLGPFFGETPETYYAHHMGMHHPENNLPDDLSTTMPYQRDSVLGFLHYWGSFVVLGLVELVMYMRRRGRTKMARSVLIGEFSFYAIVALLWSFHWQATVSVFVVPLLFARFAMMAGNWGQHAFVDADDPGNAYRNSITCINAGYNHRCFNDGYHIGHHLSANRHWTDLPVEFMENRDEYLRQGAIIFEGIDFFMVWLLLMLKRYDLLADRFVQLGATPLPREKIIALLKERTARIDTGSYVAATAAG